jgi:hypothetical protein
MSSTTQAGGAKELNTAAAVIAYVFKIEQETADFYETWAQKYDECYEIFLSFVKDNKKNEKNIKRAYYGVVSDALETNFCFEGLRVDLTIPQVGQEASPSEVLKTSLDLERSIRAFYEEASAVSRALLADVTRVMDRVAKSRKVREEKLRSMLEKG